MKDEETQLQPTFHELKRYAEDKRVEIHPSFFTEIKNYSRHEGVRELSTADLHLGLVTIGRLAINRGGLRIGAGAVRATLDEWCDDPFSPCSRAVRKILEEEQTSGNRPSLG